MTPAAIHHARLAAIDWHRERAAAAWAAAAQCQGDARDYRRAEAEWHDRVAETILKQMERSDG